MAGRQAEVTGSSWSMVVTVNLEKSGETLDSGHGKAEGHKYSWERGCRALACLLGLQGERAGKGVTGSSPPHPTLLRFLGNDFQAAESSVVSV